jgi:tagatose-6-phosphate ketose/aldose isomerase
MAALDRDCLFVCFLSGKSQVQAYERDLLRELGSKQLGRRRVVISGSEQAFDSYADIYLAPGIPVEIPDEYRVPVDLIFGQLLGLFSSIQWGLMPDQPSPTGVISRVVQNVSIHG